MAGGLLDLKRLPVARADPVALQAEVAALAAGLPGAVVSPPTGPDADDVARAALATFGGVRCGYDPLTLRLEAALGALTLDAMGLPPATPITLTASGSESLFLALAAARSGRRGGRVVASRNVHPATLRASGLLRLEAIRVPTRPQGGADPQAVAAAMDADTVAVVASAPGWADGMSDPIATLGALAAERGAPCVLDACIGGMLHPFLAGGLKLDPPGVSAVAVDLHKFGYAPQNLSAVCFLDPAGAAATAFFDDGWDGFPYKSRGVAGDRPFGALVAAWVTMLGLGRAGYRERAERQVSRRNAIAAAAQAAGLALARTPATVAVCVEPGPEGLRDLGARLTAAGVPHIACPQPGFIRLRIEPLSAEADFQRFLGQIAAVRAA